MPNDSRTYIHLRVQALQISASYKYLFSITKCIGWEFTWGFAWHHVNSSFQSHANTICYIISSRILGYFCILFFCTDKPQWIPCTQSLLGDTTLILILAVTTSCMAGNGSWSHVSSLVSQCLQSNKSVLPATTLGSELNVCDVHPGERCQFASRRAVLTAGSRGRWKSTLKSLQNSSSNSRSHFCSNKQKMWKKQQER